MKMFSLKTVAAVVLVLSLSLSLATTPTASAQSSTSESPGEDVLTLVPDLLNLSSVAGFETPFTPAGKSPSAREGAALQSAIETFLTRQGYRIDRGGEAEAEALKLAKRGYNGEFWLNSNGVSNSIYFPHGEGMVSKVTQRNKAATTDWYLNNYPGWAQNPKRAGVQTWAEPGGDIFVAQFFTYQ
ncbi:hypothetical protein [Corynebacterium sp. A21]|uniref:hypothetical protein n=1 Tax=Corynebacterium sp. A21 TaxID=3457318 RepID=UPI003FD5A28C